MLVQNISFSTLPQQVYAKPLFDVNQVAAASDLVIAGVHAELPWIMLMPGFNCYASDYTTIQQLLAGKGYLVAIADQFHPVDSLTAGLLLSGESSTWFSECSQDDVVC